MKSIIVTIGPSSIQDNVLRKLLRAGATSFRINLSHSSVASLDSYLAAISAVGITPALDTQGAQLRAISTNGCENLLRGETVYIYFGKSENDGERPLIPFIRLNHPEAYPQTSVGDLFKVDFSGLSLRVKSLVKENYLIAEVETPGALVLNRAVDIQGKRLQLSTITAFDKYALKLASEKSINTIYASFISSAQDVKDVRNAAPAGARIISKIETSKGVSNVREICDASDEILIDRGDLSREISIPAIPLAVSSIINVAKKSNTPINIATNVLDSMLTNPIPSRAEISDIFSHLERGVDGFVLAAEVAIGNHPIESTALVNYLIHYYENYFCGLHGLGEKPECSSDLLGIELSNWM